MTKSRQVVRVTGFMEHLREPLLEEVRKIYPHAEGFVHPEHPTWYDLVPHPETLSIFPSWYKDFRADIEHTLEIRMPEIVMRVRPAVLSKSV